MLISTMHLWAGNVSVILITEGFNTVEKMQDYRMVEFDDLEVLVFNSNLYA